jgi:hypothetical protein
MSFQDDKGYDSKLERNPRGVNETLRMLKASQPGVHCLFLYPDLTTLRAIYS